jgi:teichuronic acid biosynthesis glycosyltransferase TuaH
VKIVYLAPVEWTSIRQRPHHMAEMLSARHDFFYIQPLGLRNMRLTDLGRMSGRLAALSRKSLTSAHLKVRTFFSIPFVNPLIEKVNIRLVKKQMKCLLDKDTVVWITSPSGIIARILGQLAKGTVVYEMMDDYAQFHPALAKEILSAETLLARRADVVIVTSAALAEKARQLNADKDPVIISNGVDYDFFSKGAVERPPDLRGMGKIAGYIGTVDSWMDLETIAFLAEKREDVDFVFVGPVKARNVPVKRNIHFIGSRDYRLIPSYCNAFDACLIPFRMGAFADTINPVKLYEYFALGKPVAAIRMKELLPFDHLLYLAECKQDFVEKLSCALAEEDSDISMMRRSIAKLNDWSQKAALVEDALRGAGAG